MKRFLVLAAAAALALATPAAAGRSRWVESTRPNPMGNAPIERLELRSDQLLVRKDGMGPPGLMFLVISVDDDVLTSSIEVLESSYATYFCPYRLRVRFDGAPAEEWKCDYRRSTQRSMVLEDSSGFARRALTAQRIMIEGTIKPTTGETAVMTFTTGMPQTPAAE